MLPQVEAIEVEPFELSVSETTRITYGNSSWLGSTAKLEQLAAELADLAGTEHVALIDIALPGDRLVRHLEVCGRKMPFTASIKTAREVAARLVDEFGERARQAERSEGVDWKALSHAVRVGRQAIELLGTGRITFPLPDADRLRRIKDGGVP